MIVSVSQQWDDIMSEAIAVTAASGLAVSVLFILIVIRTVRLISKYVVRPIKMEEAVLAEYVRDKDPEKVITSLSEVKCRNEIETLAENFSYMAAEIDTHIKTVRAVTAEKERIGAELDMAAKIQASQLPSTFPAFPDRTEFDIYASMDPAKEVGGDFYDFFLIDDDHLAVVIADVSGKGVPAALFMMSSKMLINSFALSGGRPSEILGAVNNMLCERSADDMFVTVWLGILELSTGKLTSTNAGHENPAIKKAGGSFEILKDRHSPVVAAMPDIPYREQVMQLEPGDTLFVYTDGVPEATSAQVELFGEERLSKALNSVGDVPLEKLLDTVNSAVSDFVGDAPQFDDLTMLALRYNGK
ncbi:MAG: SpoIIE family protein phosphatase [Ruminiclostridium sp.]|nr:SpoIIE family protein phosphatase [Ruminiclostridium sp.]